MRTNVRTTTSCTKFLASLYCRPPKKGRLLCRLNVRIAECILFSIGIVAECISAMCAVKYGERRNRNVKEGTFLVNLECPSWQVGTTRACTGVRVGGS